MCFPISCMYIGYLTILWNVYISSIVLHFVSVEQGHRTFMYSYALYSNHSNQVHALPSVSDPTPVAGWLGLAGRRSVDWHANHDGG